MALPGLGGCPWAPGQPPAAADGIFAALGCNPKLGGCPVMPIPGIPGMPMPGMGIPGLPGLSAIPGAPPMAFPFQANLPVPAPTTAGSSCPAGSVTVQKASSIVLQAAPVISRAPTNTAAKPEKSAGAVVPDAPGA